MPCPGYSADLVARELVDQFGERARQAVVDNIVSAIREHDLVSAKRWDEVGHAVDRRLAA